MPVLGSKNVPSDKVSGLSLKTSLSIFIILFLDKFTIDFGKREDEGVFVQSQ